MKPKFNICKNITSFISAILFNAEISELIFTVFSVIVFFTINWAASKIANHILCKKKQDSKNVKM